MRFLFSGNASEGYFPFCLMSRNRNMIVSRFNDFQNKIGVLLSVAPINRLFSLRLHGHICISFCVRQGNLQTITLCQVQISRFLLIQDAVFHPEPGCIGYPGSLKNAACAASGQQEKHCGKHTNFHRRFQCRLPRCISLHQCPRLFSFFFICFISNLRCASSSLCSRLS